MAHKVHPKVFRIKGIQDWPSRWFDVKNFPANLESDMLIREFLDKKLAEAGIQGVEIERHSDKVRIIINTTRPGVIIGRQGKGAEDLKKELDKKFFSNKNKKKQEVKLEIREIKNPWTNSLFIAQYIAQQIEKRARFRSVMKQAIKKATLNKEIKGIKIDVSGRLNGGTIARREWLSQGRLPRTSLRADIDYGFWEARCTYGTIGVKVWLYKGEKFD